MQNFNLKSTRKKRNLHNNLTYLLSKHAIDLHSLSLQTGIPIATIFRMKKKDHNPTIASVEPIAEYFNINLTELIYDDIASDDFQNKKKIGNIQYLPMIKLDDIKSWPVEFNSQIYIGTTGELNKNAFCVLITSNSLSPVFLNNSVVVIDPALPPRDGDYIFCLIENSQIPIFRQLFIDGSHYFFKPINPNYGEMKTIKEFKILGIITKSIDRYR